MATKNAHDSWYKKFFSNPVMVRELLTSFVHEEFVHNLEFDLKAIG